MKQMIAMMTPRVFASDLCVRACDCSFFFASTSAFLPPIFPLAVTPGACDGPNPPPECRRCDERGSISLTPDPTTGLCNCKVSNSFQIEPQSSFFVRIFLSLPFSAFRDAFFSSSFFFQPHFWLFGGEILVL